MLKKNIVKLISFFLTFALFVSLVIFSEVTSVQTDPSKDSTINSSSNFNKDSEIDSETDAESDEESTFFESDFETETETTLNSESVPEYVEPEFINPLTGLESEKDFTGKRPAAIMINNIKISCPQEGVSKADIMYECLVEGGYTRLMMVVADYESLPVIGSVRSSRDYYIDFAQNHDAVYFHAGGSPQAYSEIKTRNIDNIDGVNMYTPSTFYRDNNRVRNMGYEHSLMTTGEGLVSAIKYWKVRTSLKIGYKSPINFVKYEIEKLLTDTASHVRIPYSASQTADFVYDKDSNKYLRYQFNGVKHIDGTTNEQLSYTNLIIVLCPTQTVAGDNSGRIAVTTPGKGNGYYVYGGKYIPIKWSRSTRDTPIVFTDTIGNLLEINRGTTFISIAPTTISSKINFNHNW